MENLEKIIEEKKIKSATRKPRYGTRKLSVGLVSCILGYMIMTGPSVVKAESADIKAVEAIVQEIGEETEVSEVMDEESEETLFQFKS